jgi:rod shape-determining protein MreC
MMNRSTSQGLFAAAILLLAVAILVLNLAGLLQPVQDAFIRPLSGLQSWISIRFSAARDFFTQPRDVAALQARISELESEVATLQQEVISLREQSTEAEILSALLNYARGQPESRYQAANVIGRDPSPFLRSILIDQGSDAGISRGMPVVTDLGLVGRVQEVFPTASRIELITDPEIAVNVRLQNSRADGVLSARVNGELFVDLIDQDAEIDEQELILTSGLGGGYPADIPIGQVISIRRRDYELFQQAVVQSAVDFDTLEIVLVITNFRPVLELQIPEP